MFCRAWKKLRAEYERGIDNVCMISLMTLFVFEIGLEIIENQRRGRSGRIHFNVDVV